MYWFRTKKSNLIQLKTFAILWFGGLFLIGIPYVIYTCAIGKPRDGLLLTVMFVGGFVVYGANRLVLSLSYREPSKTSNEEIEAARKMLHGDKK